jgi:hypothetical protein
MSGSCCSACDWLCGNDERTIFATPGAYQPLLPGHRDTKAVYAAGKQQQRREFGRQGSADQDTRQQASGEVSGHGLLADACPLSCAQCKSSFANRDAPAQLAAYSLVESFLGWFGGLGGLWGGLTPMVGRCVGRGDEEGAGRLLKMSFACCLFSTAVAWTIVYPFGGLIVQGAFAPQQDVYHYAIPFMHVHAAGMFFQYFSVPHSYCDNYHHTEFE